MMRHSIETSQSQSPAIYPQAIWTHHWQMATILSTLKKTDIQISRENPMTDVNSVDWESIKNKSTLARNRWRELKQALLVLL